MESPPPSPAKTILLVDDHDEYRVMARWFLISFGFIVESARTATDALALFDPETHDLVITDNSMPGMSGAALAQIIKQRSPGTPVLMCSGHLPEDRSDLDFAIQKPVHLLTVKEAVERILGRSAPPIGAKDGKHLPSGETTRSGVKVLKKRRNSAAAGLPR